MRVIARMRIAYMQNALRAQTENFVRQIYITVILGYNRFIGANSFGGYLSDKGFLIYKVYRIGQ